MPDDSPYPPIPTSSGNEQTTSTGVTGESNTTDNRATGPEALQAAPASFVKRLIFWVRRHPSMTVLILLGLFLAGEALTIPFFGVERLRTENPAETALMRQRKREAERDRKPLRIKQKWIPLSRIPKSVIDAVIVAEDGTFYSHAGFDWFEVRESIEKNIDQRRVARGASTITQQLAKNLYLSTSKDPVRKLKEFAITVLLENDLSKNRILELYLNCIEWGRGIFGIEAASETYFGKSASDLTLDEAARLAAVIPSPLRHRPDVDSRYVMYRKQIVLTRLSARNLVPQEQGDTPSGPPGQVSDSTGSMEQMDSEGDNDNGF